MIVLCPNCQDAVHLQPCITCNGTGKIERTVMPDGLIMEQAVESDALKIQRLSKENEDLKKEIQAVERARGALNRNNNRLHIELDAAEQAATEFAETIDNLFYSIGHPFPNVFGPDESSPAAP